LAFEPGREGPPGASVKIERSREDAMREYLKFYIDGQWVDPVG